MEGLHPLHRRVAGIDVHRMLHVVTVLIEETSGPNAGSISKHSREFGGFKRDCRALAQWLHELGVELVVMESTGIYWKSVYAHLENTGIQAWVVNAHFIKHVPGRKTDMLDSEWLAVVTDVHGVSARAMVKGLIEGQDPAELPGLARGALKRKHDTLALSLEGDLSARHRFVLQHLHDHIDVLQQQLAEIDAYLLDAMQPYAWAHGLLQTIPGLDQIAAALILIEVGDDMTRFGCAARLACWAALSPGNNESAGKRKSGRTGHGNSTIGYILCECANAARMTKSTLASKYKSLMVRKSHKKAIVAISHKMIRLIYVLLTRRQGYIDQGIDYAAMSAAKNAPRWIKQLKAISKWPAAQPTPEPARTL